MPRRSLVSKGIPNALPHELPRTGVLKRLADPDWRLVILTAPAGYGKTTLLAQIARASSGPVAWLTCTEDDADPSTLLQSIATALQRAAPRLILSGWRDAVTVGATPQRQAQRLAADLNTSKTNLGVVLDRCERLSTDAGRAIEGFVDQLGEGHRVLVAGYEIPGAPVAHWVAQGHAVRLEANELAFTEQETRAYLRLRGSPLGAVELHASVHGWPVGVALSAGIDAPPQVAENLVQDLLERLPDALRCVVPMASVLSVWSEAEAARFDLPLPRGWVRQTVRAGLPLTPLGAGRYRPHTLLSEALDTEFRAMPEYRTVHRRIAEDFESRGEELSAVRHHLAAGQADVAVRLAERIVPELMRFAQHQIAERVLQSIPEGMRSDRLRVFVGWLAIVAGHNQTAADLLRPLHARGVRDGYLAWLLAMVEYVFGDFETQVRIAAEGLELEPDPHVQCLVYVAYASGLQRLNRKDQCLEVARRGYALAQALQDPLLIARLSSVLFFAFAELKQLDEAKRVIRHGIAVAERCGFKGRKRELVSIYTLYCAVWGEFEEAIGLITPYLKGEQPHQGLLYIDGLCHYRTHLNPTRALERFDQAIAYYRRIAHLDLVFSSLLWKADIFLLQCDVAAARAVLEEARSTLASFAVRHLERLRFLEARFHLIQGDVARAERLLKDDPESLEEWDDGRFFAYRAEVARRRGTLSQSMLEPMWLELDRLTHDGPLLTDGHVLRSLYEACIERGWYAERFQAVLERLALPRQDIDVRPLLRLKAFGTLEVRLNAQAVRMPLAKSAELLVYLALHGATRRDELVDAVFGGERGSKHAEYFKVAMRRLRAALRTGLEFDPIVVQDGVYRLSEELRLEVDVDGLWHDQVSLEPRETLPWLESFRGAFLPKSESEWVSFAQQRLLDARIGVALRAAATLEEDAPEDAVRLYRWVIALDPWTESAYEALQRVFDRLGNLGARQQVTRQLEQVRQRVFH